MTFQAERARPTRTPRRAISLAGQGVPGTRRQVPAAARSHDPGPAALQAALRDLPPRTPMGGVNEFPTEGKDAKVQGLRPRRLRNREVDPRAAAHPEDPHYFGHTKLTGMIKWAEGVRTKRKEMTAAQKAEQDAPVRPDCGMALHPSRGQTPGRERQRPVREATRRLPRRRGGCVSCHGYNGKGGGDSAPDLTGYGSAHGSGSWSCRRPIRNGTRPTTRCPPSGRRRRPRPSPAARNSATPTPTSR